jgi:hypothetical protein
MTFIGLEGSFEWAFEAADTINSKLANASPGVLFTVVGFFIIVSVSRRQKIKIEGLGEVEMVVSETKVYDPTDFRFHYLAIKSGDPIPKINPSITGFLVKEAGAQEVEICIDGETRLVQPCVLHTPGSLKNCKAGDIVTAVIRQQEYSSIWYCADEKWRPPHTNTRDEWYLPTCAGHDGSNVICYLCLSRDNKLN